MRKTERKKDYTIFERLNRQEKKKRVIKKNTS